MKQTDPNNLPRKPEAPQAADHAAAMRADASAGGPRQAAQPSRSKRSSRWKCPRCGTRKLLRGDR